MILSPILREAQEDTLRGIGEEHRKIYALLLVAPHGLTRDQLVTASGLSDRRARKVLEELRIIAAVIPHPKRGRLVIGFDPETQVYRVARDRVEADSIMAYHASRVRHMVAALAAQVEAAEESFGPSEITASIQGVLFDAKQVLNAWRGG